MSTLVKQYQNTAVWLDLTLPAEVKKALFIILVAAFIGLMTLSAAAVGQNRAHTDLGLFVLPWLNSQVGEAANHELVWFALVAFVYLTGEKRPRFVSVGIVLLSVLLPQIAFHLLYTATIFYNAHIAIVQGVGVGVFVALTGIALLGMLVSYWLGKAPKKSPKQ